MQTTNGQAIRAAATVVVLRERAGAGSPDIYMVRRSARSGFMPNALVFPGGKLDAADGPAGSDAAYQAAARRECVEESRIDLGARPLRWFDTWLTPSIEPRRFLARFYLARLDPHEGAGAAADGHETHDGQWAPAREFLDRSLRGELFLPPPTVTVLMRLAESSWLTGLEDAPDYQTAELAAPILPKWVRVPSASDPDDLQDLIVLPHDPEYAQLAGEGAPAPSRAHALPRRFLRQGFGWRLDP
ncbi:MAG: NUDIX hydrolase [Nannocystaceae bacterium]|nr:NUDIX hydrolase [Myxococcales bacterium]